MKLMLFLLLFFSLSCSSDKIENSNIITNTDSIQVSDIDTVTFENRKYGVELFNNLYEYQSKLTYDTTRFGFITSQNGYFKQYSLNLENHSEELTIYPKFENDSLRYLKLYFRYDRLPDEIQKQIISIYGNKYGIDSTYTYKTIKEGSIGLWEDDYTESYVGLIFTKNKVIELKLDSSIIYYYPRTYYFEKERERKRYVEDFNMKEKRVKDSLKRIAQEDI